MRKDLITAELQRLSEILAKIMGLKLEGQFTKAQEILNTTLAERFGLPLEILEQTDVSVFENWLEEQNLSPEKLDSLSEFLYYELGISAERNKLIATKLDLVYNFLSDQHKIVHLVNMHRQKNIQQYL
ncbi:hypothetical protein [Pedobacter sp. MW01-1-1]|uniref:hypothetical protein n=1 Tax=Pedobacter sp. MW01-1-1 TaxID=3383027 RepID=UPI003FF036BD